MNASIRLLLCLPLMGLTVACSGKDDGSDESTGTDVTETEEEADADTDSDADTDADTDNIRRSPFTGAPRQWNVRRRPWIS